jgi:hypothetical protein
MMRMLWLRRWWSAFPRNFMTVRERVNVYILYPLCLPLTWVAFLLAIDNVSDIMERLPIGIVAWMLVIVIDRVVEREMRAIRERRWDRIEKALDRPRSRWKDRGLE